MRQKTLIKIISLLRKDMDNGLTIMSISKRLKIGYRPAYNHIETMEKEGIVIVKRIGNAKQSFLNLDSEKCRHLLIESDMARKEELFKKNQKLGSVLDGLVSKFSETLAPEIHSVILFGSYAKGASSKLSDVDLMFIVTDLKNKNTREVVERECSGYNYSHNIKISPLITDVTEFKKMLKAKELNIGKEVKAHGLPLYGSEAFWRLVK